MMIVVGVEKLEGSVGDVAPDKQLSRVHRQMLSRAL